MAEVKEGELVEKKKKRGRPKGSKDKLPRLRSPTLKDLKKVDPESQTKAVAVFTAKFISSGKMDKLLEKMVEVAFDDDHKLQGMAWQELMKRGLPMSMFEDARGGGNGPVINISIGSADSIDIDGD